MLLFIFDRKSQNYGIPYSIICLTKRKGEHNYDMYLKLYKT